MGLKKGIFKILALKMLWKNVWVVSFYYHFKGFFGEKKGTTEWGEGRWGGGGRFLRELTR